MDVTLYFSFEHKINVLLINERESQLISCPKDMAEVALQIHFSIINSIKFNYPLIILSHNFQNSVYISVSSKTSLLYIAFDTNLKNSIDTVI